MKKLLMSISILLVLSFFLAACQGKEEEQGDGEAEANANDEQTSSEDEQHNHDEDKSHDQAPEGIKIEGIADHYHTGDGIELTAVLDEENASDHWHWYSREGSEAEWKAVAGQETNTFSGEATMDGLEIKAVLFDGDHTPIVQSAPVQVVIDDHHGDDEESQQIYNGYFEDGQVEDRELSDWDGDWQSVYPYLLSGDLDEVFAHKTEDGDMTAEEYKDYYTIGYETEVERVLIKDNQVTFFENGTEYSGQYKSGGYEILNYEAGNRGVRFIFELVEGSEEMPQYIQFSDHSIAPVDSHHFHLYWGDDREQLLEEVTNWPTYYPADLDAAGLVRDMLAH